LTFVSESTRNKENDILFLVGECSLFYNIIDKLSSCINFLLPMEITMSLKLCGKILLKVQPAMSANSTVEKSEGEVKLDTNGSALPIESVLTAIPLEKSQSDSKLNKPIAAESTHNFSDRSPR
jgi:hypothetical protein